MTAAAAPRGLPTERAGGNGRRVAVILDARAAGWVAALEHEATRAGAARHATLRRRLRLARRVEAITARATTCAPPTPTPASAGAAAGIGTDRPATEERAVTRGDRAS